VVYRVKIAVQRIEPSESRPHGIKYSLTLHGLYGRRLYGIDNAHAIRRRGGFDHRHVYRGRRPLPYPCPTPIGGRSSCLGIFTARWNGF
jgi:hypothetical protein